MSGWEDKHWSTITKVERQKQEIERRSQVNTARTESILREVEKTKEMGTDTLTTMKSQSEQIKRIHENADEIDNQLTFSERTIRGMESVFGSVRNWFSSGKYNAPPKSSGGPSHGAQSEPSGSTYRPSDETAQPSSQRMRGGDRGHEEVSTSSARTKLLQEGRNLSGQERRDLEYKARLEEMEMRQDRNLDSISGAVKDLKGMSQMMRDELNVQNTSVDELNTKMDKLDGRMRSSNKRINKLL